MNIKIKCGGLPNDGKKLDRGRTLYVKGTTFFCVTIWKEASSAFKKSNITELPLKKSHLNQQNVKIYSVKKPAWKDCPC